MTATTATTTRPTNANIFRAYNAARHAAKAGTLDAGRVNRALGLALSKGTEWDGVTLQTPYTRKTKGMPLTGKHVTTTTGCTCEDHQYRGVTCKHMIALFMLLKASRMEAAAAATAA